MSAIAKFIAANVVAVAVLVVLFGVSAAFGAPVDAETTQVAVASTQGDMARACGYLAIALTMCGAIGATGFAVAKVGSSAMGAISEKPELAGKALIFVGLAEGIAIYGVLMSFLLLQALK